MRDGPRGWGLGESYVLDYVWVERIREASRRALEGQEHGKGRALLTREQPSKAWSWDQKYHFTPGVRQEASGSHTYLDRQGSAPDIQSLR